MNSTCELGRHSAHALKPYPDYKDSGVQWLGKVPDHWRLPRLGALLRERGEMNGDRQVSEVLSLLRERGVIPYAEKGNIGNKKSEDITRYKVVRPDDIVVNCMNVIIGSVGLSRYTGCLSPVYYVLTRRSERDHPRYLNACFQTKPFQESLVRIGNGILAHRMRIPMELLKCEPFPRPPFEEQAAIVRFLDHADRRIRRYIRAKQKLLALLEEQKQAIIHQAVTGQIDVRTGRPYGVYKPAGVLGLPEVPKDWELCRLRNVASVVTTGSRGWSSYASDTGPLFVRVANLSRGSLKLRFDDEVRLDLPSTSEAGRTRIKPGDLLVSVTAYIGSVGIAPEELEEAYVSQHVARCQPLPEVCSRWLGYVLLSSVGQTHGQVSLYGGTKDGLSLDDVKNYPILLPPRNEQEAAVQWIEGELSALVKIGDSTKRELEMVREYRTRLIADVVTGKLDVREAAAGLPDEVEELEPPDEADAFDGEEESPPTSSTVP